jgi:hypothetical protein
MDRANGAGPGGAAAATRAERFEDEKRRIIDSCFSKKDTDGSCEFPTVAANPFSSPHPVR